MTSRRQYPAALVLIFAIAFTASAGDPALKPQRVSYQSGDTIRHGCLYKPEGGGPFPTVVFNQASAEPVYDDVSSMPFAELARFFTSHGYVFFLPGRFAHEGPGVAPTSSPEARVKWLHMHDMHNSDIVAAMDWLKAQACVDENKIIMVGHSSGAIQTLLVSGIKQDIRGSIVFSPGAMVWQTNPALAEILQNATSTCRAPVFLIQVQNDSSIKPSEVLGNILARKGQPNRVKVYPAFGDKPTEAINFCVNAPGAWGNDALAFMETVLR